MFWPFLFLLLPATAVLVFGVIGMWNAVRASRDTARNEASRAALSLAREIRSALHDPEILATIPTRCGFRVVDGELEIPAGLPWVNTPAEENPEAELPRPVFEDLKLLRGRGETGTGELAALYDRALEHPQLRRSSREWLALMVAWDAHRRGDVRRRGEMLATLGDLPAYRSVIAGAILLRVSVGEPFPPWWRQGAVSITESQSDALLLRLGELGREHERRQLRKVVDDARRRRAVLAKVRPLVPLLGSQDSPHAQAVANDLLLYFPAPGRGALLTHGELRALLAEIEPTVASEDVVIGDAIPDDAFPAVPLVGVIPTEVAAGPGWSDDWTLVGMLVILVGFLLLGATLCYRALRQERIAVATRADFLTAVTHELKTPLSSIHLISEMLHEQRIDDPERQQRYLDNLVAESARLRMLVENVLDLGRIERGERSYDLRRERIDELVAEAVDLFTPLAQRDGIAISTSVDGEARTLADREAIIQVFLNLMENARRYAGDAKELDIETIADNGTVEVRFTDAGPGLDPGEREAVFGKFQRGAAARAGGNPGVGLGLYLSRSILRSHGGDLRHEPRADRRSGACFVARLPVAAS